MLLTKALCRRALHLEEGHMEYHERGGHKDEERERCAAQEYPT